MTEGTEQKKAVLWVRENKKYILEKFASDKIYEPDSRPVSVFMAGSPGSGKTELATSLYKEISAEQHIKNIVHIDADQIRNIIDGYEGDNSHVFHKAADKGVNFLHNYCLKRNKNFILDGTFHSQELGKQNIERSLKRNRSVWVFYIYLDAKIAWEITRKREDLEGRRVPKGVFINKLFASRVAVQKVIDLFGNEINVKFIYKGDLNKENMRYYNNVKNIDELKAIPYSRKSLIAEL